MKFCVKCVVPSNVKMQSVKKKRDNSINIPVITATATFSRRRFGEFVFLLLSYVFGKPRFID